MRRRKFNYEESLVWQDLVERRVLVWNFKPEAVRLVKDRGVMLAQASRDLDVHGNVPRKWMRELAGDPRHAFPVKGLMKPARAELARLKKENATLRIECDILKKVAAYFAKESM